MDRRGRERHRRWSTKRTGGRAIGPPARAARLGRRLPALAGRDHTDGRGPLPVRATARADHTLLAAAAAQHVFRAVQLRRLAGWRSPGVCRGRAGRQKHTLDPPAFRLRRAANHGRRGRGGPFLVARQSSYRLLRRRQAQDRGRRRRRGEDSVRRPARPRGHVEPGWHYRVRRCSEWVALSHLSHRRCPRACH